MSNRQRNLIIGGAMLVGGVAGAAYLYSRGKETKKPVEQSKTISRELVIRVLKEIQREMFGVLTNIAMISNQLKEQTRGRIPNQEIRELLLNQNTQTKDQIKNISESICEKYGFEEKDLRHACETTYQEDKEIRILLNDAKTVFDKAFMGIPPDLRTEIPSFLTPEVTLNLMKKTMQESLFKMQDFLADLKSKGIKISYDSPQMLMALQDLDLDGLRKKILVDAGLDKFQDPPLKIFHYATQKYSTEDPDQFTQKLMKLELQNQKAMDALMKDSPDAAITIEAIGAHLAKDSEELMANHARNARLHKPAFAKPVQEEKKDEEDDGKTEDEKALAHIQTLQHQVSFDLKAALEENEFPKDLVESAINTLSNVFGKLGKVQKNSSTDVNKTASPNTSVIQSAVHESHPVVHSHEEKPVIVETSTVETKEVVGEDGVTHAEAVAEDKVVVETDNYIHTVTLQEKVEEKPQELNEGHHHEENNQ